VIIGAVAAFAWRHRRGADVVDDLFLSLPQLPLLLLLIYLFRDALKMVFGPEVGRVPAHRRGHRHVPLDAGGAPVRAQFFRCAKRVRRGGAGAWRFVAAPGGAPHPAEFARGR